VRRVEAWAGVNMPRSGSISIVLLAAMITAGCTLPASASERIAADPGGQIGPYLEKLQSLRNSGQNVIIDGPCLSACTMVLGMIPHDRICVTPRARLGFHAAWRRDPSGRQTTSRDGTELLMSVYPQQVRDWISRRGGLSPQLMYLSGGELASMYPACGAGAPATADRGSRREHVAQGLHPSKAHGASVSAAARIQ
jgi:hypothetical protein